MGKGHEGAEQRESVQVKIDGNELIIGDALKLIVNLQNQNNYLEFEGRKIPYYRDVRLSKDLLDGKRAEVYHTAVEYYYKQACSVAAGVQTAEKYRTKANRTVREMK